jgi:hypothetical protein
MRRFPKRARLPIVDETRQDIEIIADAGAAFVRFLKAMNGGRMLPVGWSLNSATYELPETRLALAGTQWGHTHS